MLLLTGATGQVGSALLGRLLADGMSVRCLVRDPRRLGATRVRVQIALGDLADPPSFRNAMRGVDTVVHLAAAIRDQPRGSIEELGGIATWRMVQAAERAGVERFMFFSALSASTHSRARFLRAKALAEQAVREAGMHSVVFSPSIVYAPGDRWLTLLERLALLPAMPMSGGGRALYQPIWAEDVADCAMAALRTPELAGSFELAGPQTLSHAEIVREVLHALHRHRPLAARAHSGRRPGAAPAGGRLWHARARHLGRGGADGGVDGRFAGMRRCRTARGASAADGGSAGASACWSMRPGAELRA